MWMLVFLPASARCASAIAVLSFQPIGHSGYAKAFEGSKNGYKIAAWLILVVLAVVPVVLFGVCGIFAVISQVAAFLAIFYGRSQLGGMSGDISGYGITIGELAGAIAIAIL